MTSYDAKDGTLKTTYSNYSLNVMHNRIKQKKTNLNKMFMNSFKSSAKSNQYSEKTGLKIIGCRDVT